MSRGSLGPGAPECQLQLASSTHSVGLAGEEVGFWEDCLGTPREPAQGPGVWSPNNAASGASVWILMQKFPSVPHQSR